MKQLTRPFALLVALLLLLSTLTAAMAEAAPGDDPVLFTFDGEAVTLSQVDDTLYNMVTNGYVESASDYDTAIQAMIQDKVLMAKVVEFGMDQFTEEEEEALRADAQAEWEDALNTYVTYFLSEDTAEARAKLREDAEAFFLTQGYDLEHLYQSLKISAEYDRIERYILEQNELTVTDEDIMGVFQQYAEQDREMYEGNIFNYEYYVLYYGYDSWYVPAGYRAVIHILLSVDDDLLSAYTDAQALYEENATDENKAALDAAYAAVIASRQTVLDDIYAQLEKGETFQSLIAKYGEDPGMKDEAQLASGYQVHPESILWDPAFVKGAFSEKMLEPGNVSDPVVGMNGIHVLYFLREIPGGFVELDDSIRTEIEAYLLNTKFSEALDRVIGEWTQEHEIVYNTEAIEAAKAQAQEQAQAQEPVLE